MTNEENEAGHAIKVKAEDISIHPGLAESLDVEIWDELIQHAFTHNVVECISNTLVFPVAPKKGMKKNRHYHLVGLIPFFMALERKGCKEFCIAIVDEPPKLDLLVGNTYQLMPIKRGIVDSAVLAALLEKTNACPEAISAKMNFIESTKCAGKFLDPIQAVTGHKKSRRVEKLLNETPLPDSVIELLKLLDIRIEDDAIGDPEEIEQIE